MELILRGKLILIFFVLLTILSACNSGGDGDDNSAAPAAPVVIPNTPEAAAITPGDSELALTWTPVDGAAAYEIWYHTENSSSSATQYAGEVTAASYTVTGLSNGTIYYVWLKAKNTAGTSAFGPSADGTPNIPPEIPEDPEVIYGNTELHVSWTPVSGAASYEVWYSTSDNPAEAVQQGGDITLTGHSVTGLENNTEYHIWIKAKNSAGASGFSEAAIQTPSEALPVLRINTPGAVEITSTEEWLEEASYSLTDTSGEELEGETKIKGRGYSTWNLMPKKPYSLKLEDKERLLGMPKHKRWVLLANWADKTLLRTEAALRLGEILNDSLRWTPKSRQVDLYLNDEYQGVYQLTEAVKIDNDRVDVENIEDYDPLSSDPDLNSFKNFGYILEVDEREGEYYHFTTTQGVVFNCKDPDDSDEITQDTADLIAADIQNVEDVIYSAAFDDEAEGYRKYIDIESFIDWYLVNEITKNRDAVFYSSCYMYFDQADQLYHMGPLWDFDLSIGNINYDGCGDTSGFHVINAKWISRLFDDPAFTDAVKARWNEKKDDFETLLSFIDTRVLDLSRAKTANFEKWPITEQWQWSPMQGSYDAEISYLKAWYTSRLNWLDYSINNL